MARRFVSIWFRHLTTDWFTIRKKSRDNSTGESSREDLRSKPFVLRAPSHGRMIITAVNATAQSRGIFPGMVLADARAIVPELVVEDDKPDLITKLLRRLAEWCIQFTPFVAIDPPDGLLFDSTGCPHLWGGDQSYLKAIEKKLNERGYDIRASIADTPGVAWAVARFGADAFVIKSGCNYEALLSLPPESLRLEPESVDRLHKLGLHQIKKFIHIPRASLRRRFGPQFLLRLDRALGREEERLEPVIPLQPYQERLPCMEPILTANGIEIGLRQLLETLCLRLLQEQKGIRTAVFKGFRVDGKIVGVEIGTSRPSHDVKHLFGLFALKLETIEPAMGIELFVLEATKVQDHFSHQQTLWAASGGLDDVRLSELIDRLGGKIGMQAIHRFIPNERYWPERSFKLASSLQEKPSAIWRCDKLRPLQLLFSPEKIEVTAPIPDYPPMLFRHRGKIYKISRADGPERIEQEWWIQEGKHRDYYRVEDEEGRRYWIFRSGHYGEEKFQWFLHGYFA